MSVKIAKSAASQNSENRYNEPMQAKIATEIDGKNANRAKSWLGVFPLSKRRFREIFIYFWTCSLVGHYGEILAGYIGLTGSWRPKTLTFVPLSPPYGFGALALILFVIPLKKKYKLNPDAVFLLGMVSTMLVELVCGLVIVCALGSNPFWNYSQLPGNILGQTTLHNGVIFGIAALIFVYGVYPFCEKLLAILNDKKVRWIFWALAISYGVDLLHAVLLPRLLK